MRKSMKWAVAIGAAMLLSGCSSVQTAPVGSLSGVAFTDSGSTVAHINATASGWYLLWIPIFTGSSDIPGGIVFNQDTCNIKTAASMVTAKAKAMGAKGTINMVSTKSSSAFLPMPLLFKWKTVTVSADAVR